MTYLRPDFFKAKFLYSISAEGVEAAGWRLICRARCVTVMIDLTPVRDDSGPARLVDMVPGDLLAGRARPRLAPAGPDRGDGRLDRVQDRHR